MTGKVRLTVQRRSVLEHIVAENDAGRPACYELSRGLGNSTPWTWLSRAGLIDSRAPFSFTFHTVYATESGRAALGEKE
jgi:hypothetical protein